MTEPELINGLISTYRILNNRIRQIPDDQLQANNSGGSVHEVISRLRDSELRFSQALKERITGVAMAEFSDVDAPVLGTETERDPTNVVLSQFGTARESTLAMLRSLPDDEWGRHIDGGRTIAERIQQLIENDRKQMERIDSLLGTA